jgi:hypothetical protein
VLYEQYAVAVELDGRAAHPGDLRWRDIRRDNAAAADGVITLRYGWLDVSQRPCLVAAQVTECSASAGTPAADAARPSARSQPRAETSRPHPYHNPPGRASLSPFSSPLT